MVGVIVPLAILVLSFILTIALYRYFTRKD